MKYHCFSKKYDVVSASVSPWHNGFWVSKKQKVVFYDISGGFVISDAGFNVGFGVFTGILVFLPEIHEIPCFTLFLTCF